VQRLLILCCAIVFLDSTFFAALTPILPDFEHGLGISEASAGVLSGAYAAGTLICALPGGWFAARFGPRRAVIVGLIGIGIFSPIFGNADEFGLLVSSRFFQGASGALLWAGAMSWVVIAGPEERRGALLGTLIAAATVGELLGSPIGALAHEIGIDVVFSAVAVVALGLLMLALTNPPVHADVPQSLRDALGSVGGSQVLGSSWLLAAASFAFGVCVVVAPLHIDDLGGSAALIAASFASGSVVETILGPLIGRASDRVGRTYPYRIGMVIGSLAILGVGAFSSLPLLFISVVLTSFGAGLAFAPAIAQIADAAEDAGIAQGYASGVSNGAWGSGQMIGAVSGGVLAASGFIVPAIVTVVVLVIAIVTAGRLADNAPQPEIAR
jgi:MFS family permease